MLKCVNAIMREIHSFHIQNSFIKHYRIIAFQHYIAEDKGIEPSPPVGGLL